MNTPKEPQEIPMTEYPEPQDPNTPHLPEEFPGKPKEQDAPDPKPTSGDAGTEDNGNV